MANSGERKVVRTKDGSDTLYHKGLDEHYHSVHGAMQEAEHVFIQHGLLYQLAQRKKLRVLEVGFGTGLNACLTLICAAQQKAQVDYIGIEAFPLSLEELRFLNYRDFLAEKGDSNCFETLHALPWNEVHQLNSNTRIHKWKAELEMVEVSPPVDLIYFDAFGPRVQPELWSVDVFASMYASLVPGGTLVTYCAKGSVKRAMKAVGFEVERLPGPPGKREMTRAHKH